MVVRFVARRMVPFIQLYALYVVAHGEDGPGGGFQGGVIFAAAFVLLALTEGWREGREAMPQGASDFLLPSGAMLYAAIGLACLLLGGAFLEYASLAVGGGEKARHAAHHFGLMGIELGVTITVAGAMATLFFEMARPKIYIRVPRRRRRDRPERRS
jgi:multicomponent Na+:H+ antiporter subunit B